LFANELWVRKTSLQLALSLLMCTCTTPKKSTGDD